MIVRVQTRVLHHFGVKTGPHPRCLSRERTRKKARERGRKRDPWDNLSRTLPRCLELFIRDNLLATHTADTCGKSIAIEQMSGACEVERYG